MLVKISCQKLESILSATLLSSKAQRGTTVSAISTDTRVIAKGDTFVALTGENYDGHDYLELAIQKGAGAIIVEREIDAVSVPQLVVKNTRHALRDLAKFQRQQFAGKVIAITGSNGKTTTKEMIKSILSIGFEVSATKGNLNNDLGVPFTVFDWEDTDAFAIVEMGANHVGEIGYLSDMVSPDIAVITNVSDAHIEGFGSLAAIAEAKSEIYDGLAEKSGIAAINIDDAFSALWLEKTREQAQVCFARVTDGQVRNRPPNVTVKQASSAGYCELEFDNGETIEFNLPIGGLHNVDNALASAAVTYALGIDVDVIAQGLATFEPASGRLQASTMIHKQKKVTIIDDTYNANPASLKAGVSMLNSHSAKRILILGDMGELGDNEASIHHEFGCLIINEIDAVFCIGELTSYFASGAREVDNNKKVAHFSSKQTLLESLYNYLGEHDGNTVLLIKGSRRAKMEQVVHGLKHVLGAEEV